MIDITIHSQPDDETCGATCLQSIYNYYGMDVNIHEIAQNVERSLSGGTLAAFLGTHALQEGFNSTIYVNNLNIFDPYWFTNGEVSGDKLISKLSAQMVYKQDANIMQSSTAYKKFVQLGGRVKFRTLTVKLLQSYFEKKIPILTGLSATYLYSSARERFTSDGISIYDDIRGTPCGHFVVLCGYDDHKKRIIVADPHRENPISKNNYYTVSSHHLINAIMLGVLTYDANLLIIEPKGI